MKKLLPFFLLSLAVISCGAKPLVKNQTRHGGYAMGEKIKLEFAVSPAKIAPDSIEVSVLEKKTGYLYALRAGKGDCQDSCVYSVIWDGRKPDGSWPMGGVYLVFASAGSIRVAFSDTVEIGLGD